MLKSRAHTVLVSCIPTPATGVSWFPSLQLVAQGVPVHRQAARRQQAAGSGPPAPRTLTLLRQGGQAAGPLGAEGCLSKARGPAGQLRGRPPPRCHSPQEPAVPQAVLASADPRARPQAAWQLPLQHHGGGHNLQVGKDRAVSHEAGYRRRKEPSSLRRGGGGREDAGSPWASEVMNDTPGLGRCCDLCSASL